MWTTRRLGCRLTRAQDGEYLPALRDHGGGDGKGRLRDASYARGDAMDDTEPASRRVGWVLETTNVAVDRSGMLGAACGDLTRRGSSPGRDPRHCPGKASADPHCRAEPRHAGGDPPQRG